MKELASAAYHGEAVKGYDILPEFTTKDRVAYKHSHSNKVYLAFRGTDLSNHRDIGTDILMGLELHHKSSRLQKAVGTAKKLKEKFGSENVILTGHSLGGSQALYASEKLGLAAEVYNPYLSYKQKKKTYHHATVHHTEGDIISKNVIGSKAKVHVHKRKRLPGLTKIDLPVINTALSHGIFST